MFPSGRGRACLEGMVPAFPQLANQSIEVFCNGSLVVRRALSFGDFAIEFLYQGPDDHSPSYIEVKALKSFVPKRHDMGNDRRSLAYHFGKLECTHSGSDS
jgi:hypothetical protein